MILDLGLLNQIILIVAIIIGTANIYLLSKLFYFYRESYKQLESKFTIGLLYFSTILLIENILLVLALIAFLILGIDIHELEGIEHYSIFLLINLAQFVALIVLFKITWD